MIKQKKIKERKNKMKKLLVIITALAISTFSLTHAADECESALAKLKPSCNILGTGVKKMKEFSSKNQTIEQSLGIKKKDGEKRKSLKEFSSEHKTINQTIEKFNNKNKK